MVLDAQTHEKLAQRVHAHTALEAEGIQCGHHQAREPLVPGLCFPSLGLWKAAPTFPCLPQTMYTALREAELLGEVANPLLPVVTKIRANVKASVPKSHVGLCSEE